MTKIGDFAQGQGVIIKKYNDSIQAKSEVIRNNRVKATVEKLELNIIQRQMFRRLMYGLDDFTSDQIVALGSKTIQIIVLDHEKAKKILHVMKAKKFYESEDKLVNAICPQGKKLSEKDYNWYLPLPKDATLRKLGITTKQIVDKFIEKHLLPKNFYELSASTLTL